LPTPDCRAEIVASSDPTGGIVFTQFLLGLATLGALTAAARADPNPSPLRLYCDAARNVAELRYFPHFHVRPEARSAADRVALIPVRADRDADCALANGIEIRVKVSQDQPRAYGLCGGSPPEWLSLWVNHSKVLSRSEYSQCQGVTLRSVRVDARGIEYCSFESRGGTGDPEWYPWWQTAFSEDRARIRNWPVTCEWHALPVPGTDTDAREYPPPGTPPRPPIGSLHLTMARSGICARMRVVGTAPQALDLPRGSSEPTWEDRGTPAVYLAEPARVATFDFDNDGRAEEVWWQAPRGYMLDGDVFAVLQRGVAMQRQWLDQILDATEAEDADDPGHRRVPAGVTLYAGTRSIFAARYRGGARYVYWRVFRFAQRTYLLGTPNNDEWEPSAVVVEPRRGELRTLCLFERTRENY
jgi:hypothetical protein